MAHASRRKGFLDSMVARLIALLIVVLGIALLVYSNRDRLEAAQQDAFPEITACVENRMKMLTDAHPKDDPLTDFDRKLYLQRAKSDCGEAT